MDISRVEKDEVKRQDLIKSQKGVGTYNPITGVYKWGSNVYDLTETGGEVGLAYPPIRTAPIEYLKKETMYYIQNKDARFLGNSIVFWALNNNGYTSKLEKCQKYTYEKAMEICTGNPHKNVAWECSYIEQNEGTCRMTDVQYLDEEFIIKF